MNLAKILFLFVLLSFKGYNSKAQKSVSDKLNNKEYVELKDRKIIEGVITKSTLLRKGTIHFKGSVTINGNTYGHDEIVAVQLKDKYIRKTVDNKFAERISEGKINVYQVWFQAGKYVGYTNYVQKGEKGLVIGFDIKDIQEMVSDYPPAALLFEEYENLSKKEKRKRGIPVQESIKIYNNQ